MSITTQPITETITTEILSASIASPATVTLSIRVEGTLHRPDTTAEIAPTVIVATVPATVLPASGSEEEEL